MAEVVFEATQETHAQLMMFAPWENKTVDDARLFIGLCVEQQCKGSALNLAIYNRPDEQFAGVAGVQKFDPFTPKAEIGYWVRQSLQGQGYAGDAVRTLLTFCRNELQLVRVDAATAESNAPSQRVLLKCGFVEEGFKEKGELCHGVWHDLRLYGKILIGRNQEIKQ